MTQDDLDAIKGRIETVRMTNGFEGDAEGEPVILFCEHDVSALLAERIWLLSRLDEVCGCLSKIAGGVYRKY